MKSIETEGKTVEQAIELGLYKLGIKREEARIDIIRQASLFDKAKVRLSLNIESEEEKKVKELTKKLIELMGLNLTVSAEEREEDFLVNVTGDDAALFIGKRGESIEEFQTIVNTIYNKDKSRDESKRIRVDSNNYIVKREETLSNLAKRMAGKVIREKRDFKFEPMNAYERRIIHSALSDNPRVTTESFGNEPNRSVVIQLKRNTPKSSYESENTEFEERDLGASENDTSSFSDEYSDEEPRNNDD